MNLADDNSTQTLRNLRDNLTDAINAVDRVKGPAEKEKVLQEMLKSHANQLTIHVPNLRHYLLSHEEHKKESTEFVDILRAKEKDLAIVREHNLELMKKIAALEDQQRLEATKREQNVKDTKAKLDQIKRELGETIQFNREQSQQNQLMNEGMSELDRKT